jgi:hypothetical protein
VVAVPAVARMKTPRPVAAERRPADPKARRG